MSHQQARHVPGSEDMFSPSSPYPHLSQEHLHNAGLATSDFGVQHVQVVKAPVAMPVEPGVVRFERIVKPGGGQQGAGTPYVQHGAVPEQ